MIGAERNAWLPRGLARMLAADAFAITTVELDSPRRAKPLVRARALFVLAVDRLGRPVSYPQLGRELGGRDHSTIINLERMAERLLVDDAEFASAFDELARRALPLLFRSTGGSTDARH